MPKVADYKFTLKGVEHVCPIYYTGKDKKFRLEKFPGEVIRPLGLRIHGGTIWGDTQNEVESKAAGHLIEFNKLQETEHRVIAVNWRAKARIKDPTTDRGWPLLYIKTWENRNPHNRGFNEPEGDVALAINYRLLVRKTNAFREHPYYVLYDPEHEMRERVETVKDHEVVLNWTPEAEAFIVQFIDMLCQSVKKMSEFLDQEPPLIEQQIMEASRLLPFYDTGVDQNG